MRRTYDNVICTFVLTIIIHDYIVRYKPDVPISNEYISIALIYGAYESSIRSGHLHGLECKRGIVDSLEIVLGLSNIRRLLVTTAGNIAYTRIAYCNRDISSMARRSLHSALENLNTLTSSADEKHRTATAGIPVRLHAILCAARNSVAAYTLQLDDILVRDEQILQHVLPNS